MKVRIFAILFVMFSMLSSTAFAFDDATKEKFKSYETNKIEITFEDGVIIQEKDKAIIHIKETENQIEANVHYLNRFKDPQQACIVVDRSVDIDKFMTALIYEYRKMRKKGYYSMISPENFRAKYFRTKKANDHSVLEGFIAIAIFVGIKYAIASIRCKIRETIDEIFFKARERMPIEIKFDDEDIKK